MNDFNLFKIEYYWYEEEHGETLICKNTSIEEFEKDLVAAKKFAESLMGKIIKNRNYLGKGYNIECLPEFYEQILWHMINKAGYISCYYNSKVSYIVDDFSSKRINLTKHEEKIEIKEVDNLFLSSKKKK